jgi:hypothetical protein
LIQGKELSKEMHDLYSKHCQLDTRPTLTELSTVLQQEAERFSTVFIVVDALDECSDEKTRTKLVLELQKLGPSVKLMITGRPHVTSDITSTFAFAGQLEIKAHDTDIEKFVEGQIELEPYLRRFASKDTEFRDLIRHTLVSKANGMYSPCA